MKRYLCWLGVLGVVAVPDWAAACRPMGGGGWGPPVYSQPVYSPPVYVMPVCPPPVYVAPPVYAPFPGPMLPPPRVEAVPRMAAPTPAPPPTGAAGETGFVPTSGMLPGAKPRAPVVETIRPTGGSDTAVSPTAPKADPAPPTVSPEPKFPVVEIPKGLQLDPKPADPPKSANPTARPPALELPKEPEFRPAPKTPSLELPKDPPATAIPSAAPATPEPLIPPPSVPLMPDAKKPDGFPPLVLPPDTPSPTKKTESISRSSPVTGTARELSVSVFPASGSEPARGGYRTVGFYNHTDRDLSLTIEGRAVKLPAKTYLHAKLGPTFTWSHGSGAATRETVPDGAAGVDVVFRE